MGKYQFLRYGICPIYAFLVLLIVNIVVNSHYKLVIFGIWVICCAGVLVPAKLIEFRYFTVPLTMLNIMITPFKPEKEDKIGFKLQLFGYIIADISLFYIFLYKPFDNGSRFMF